MAQPSPPDPFDLVVVGGGIVGAGTAALAARLGLRVALLERGDFGGATSSASSKLIHGGLRYLRMGDVRLVREALAEARVLRETVAPHLVHDLDFVLPVYRRGPYGPTAIRAALAAYRALGGGRGRVVSATRAARRAPALRVDGLRAAGLYADAQTNDARLCLANVRAAADAGAFVAGRTAVSGIERGPEGLVVHAAGLELRTRTVVNAAGPWVDEVRRLEDPRAGTSVALSKGVHLVLDLPPGLDVALTIPVDRTRVAFALPWEGVLLLGTTDTEVDGPDGAATVTAEDEAQVLAEAACALPADVLRPETIRARFAGLRVLPLRDGATARRRREVTLSRGPLGMLSVAGGKLTTYRLIARSALGALRADLGGGVGGIEPFPLPGAADPDAVAAGLDVEPGLARHLARTYGSLAGEVLALSAGRADALEPLADGEPEVVAQVVYARDREWATEPEDVLRRRTTLALRGRATAEVEARVRAVLAESGVAGPV
jgi:glycerol-3-phosphate dehydrogenase